MKALSLFSGIGGIDLACDWAGIETVAFCEREPFCQKVLRKHWPNVPIYDDVCTLTKERLDADGIGPIELIHGGYPCQPFSHAGHREGQADDRHLWPEYFRLVQEIRPRWVVGENVVGHVTLGLDDVLSDLEGAGYTARPIVIPAAAVGAQHRRERVFIMACSLSELPHGSRTAWDRWTEFTDGSEIVAHANSPRELQQERDVEELRGWFGYSSEVMADTNSKRLQRCQEAGNISGGGAERKEHPTRRYPGQSVWSIEPRLGRVANGIPQRVDRLKSLGNAVFPGQIYPFLASIKQIDDMLQ